MQLCRPLLALTCLVIAFAGCRASGERDDRPRSAAVAATNSPLPAQYRDFKLYVTSEPADGDDARIEATATLLNQGDKPLDVRATLGPSEALGFAGSEFQESIPPGGEAQWRIDLRPREGFEGETLRGQVAFGGRVDRDLFVRVLPADEGEPEQKDVERITEKARVVASQMPRTRESVRRSMAEQEEAEARRERLTLARDGQSDRRIVVVLPESQADRPESFDAWVADRASRPAPEQELIDAVLDLRRVVELQSGAELPVELGSVAGEGAGDGDERQPRTVLSVSADAAGEDAHPDAYRLSASGKDVRIEGASIDGLRNGIYALLTDHLGARWFMPGELGEEIPVPEDRTVSVPADLDDTGTPDFFSVTGMSWGASRLWDVRNRAFANRGRMSFGHAWASYLNSSDELYEQHPDWWARDREGNIRKFDRPGGGSRTNFCSTHPEVIEIVAEGVNKFLDENPEAIVASLDPNDYAPMCLCDRCLALDKRYGVEVEDGTRVADRLIHFSNEIDKRLKPEHQDKYLGILIYGYQMDPPVSAQAHDRHAGIICQMPWKYDHTRPFNDPTSPQNREFEAYVKAWGDAIPQMGFYDYYGHWQLFGPWAMVHKIREDMPAFREMGGTFIVHEAQPNFGMHGLNHYVAARLAWDTEADVDVLLEEYFTRFYGPAAEAMRAFWSESEAGYALLRPGPNSHRRFAALPGIWDRLEGRLADAERAVAAEGVPQRFEDRLAFHRDAFDYGRWRWEFEQRHDLSRIDMLGVGRDRSKVKDREAAIRELRERQPWLSAMQAKYPEGEGYWPPMLARYFWIDVDQLVREIEAAEPAPEPAVFE